MDFIKFASLHISLQNHAPFFRRRPGGFASHDAFEEDPASHGTFGRTPENTVCWSPENLEFLSRVLGVEKMQCDIGTNQICCGQVKFVDWLWSGRFCCVKIVRIHVYSGTFKETFHPKKAMSRWVMQTYSLSDTSSELVETIDVMGRWHLDVKGLKAPWVSRWFTEKKGLNSVKQLTRCFITGGHHLFGDGTSPNRSFCGTVHIPTLHEMI